MRGWLHFHSANIRQSVLSLLNVLGPGAGAGLTVTFKDAVVEAVGPEVPSCEVAVTERVKSASELAGGLIVRPDRVQPLMSIDVCDASAVKL